MLVGICQGMNTPCHAAFDTVAMKATAIPIAGAGMKLVTLDDPSFPAAI